MNAPLRAAAVASTPIVRSMRVVPVAGRDSMLLNLSGAHGPFFTRNLLILTDSSGATGVGEVPGGERIRQTLEDARPLVEGRAMRSTTPSSPLCAGSSPIATPAVVACRRSTCVRRSMSSPRSSARC
jgi:hypothetical protein